MYCYSKIKCVCLSPAQKCMLATIPAHMLTTLTIWPLGGVGTIHNFLPIILALCLLLFSNYYAHNYASIIGAGLIWQYNILK